MDSGTLGNKGKIVRCPNLDARSGLSAPPGLPVAPAFSESTQMSCLYERCDCQAKPRYLRTSIVVKANREEVKFFFLVGRGNERFADAECRNRDEGIDPEEVFSGR